MNDFFASLSNKVSEWVGSHWALMLALLVIIVWGITGPVFHFSDTWQLIINTGTTIVTFLMTFLIQNTQNRDSKALHLKLDEIIRALPEARNTFIETEDMTEEQLENVEHEIKAAVDEKA